MLVCGELGNGSVVFFWLKFEFLELVLLFWTMGPGLVIIAL